MFAGRIVLLSLIALGAAMPLELVGTGMKMAVADRTATTPVGLRGSSPRGGSPLGPLVGARSQAGLSGGLVDAAGLARRVVAETKAAGLADRAAAGRAWTALRSHDLWRDELDWIASDSLLLDEVIGRALPTLDDSAIRGLAEIARPQLREKGYAVLPTSRYTDTIAGEALHTLLREAGNAEIIRKPNFDTTYVSQRPTYTRLNDVPERIARVTDRLMQADFAVRIRDLANELLGVDAIPEQVNILRQDIDDPAAIKGFHYDPTEVSALHATYGVGPNAYPSPPLDGPRTGRQVRSADGLEFDSVAAGDTVFYFGEDVSGDQLIGAVRTHIEARLGELRAMAHGSPDISADRLLTAFDYRIP